ncbi:MAG: hypothetical protein VYC68_04290, partial [Candidatus Thermoplasmatota archaeon]|nr:hypothetical protein [Candidatus Thermoplasmatota archaeon]
MIPELLLRPLRIMPAVPLLSAQREHTSSQCMDNGNDGGDDEHGEDAALRPPDAYQHVQLQPAQEPATKKARTEIGDSEKQAAAAAAVEGEGAAEAAAAVEALKRIQGFRFELNSAVDLNTMNLDGQREALEGARDRADDLQEIVQKNASLTLPRPCYQWSTEFDQSWAWRLRCLTCDVTYKAKEDNDQSKNPFYKGLLKHFKTDSHAR